MKSVFFMVFLGLLGSAGTLAQAQESPFQYVEVEGGVTVPIGNLKNTMNTAPHVGLWLRQPYTQNSIWAFGFNFNFPNSSRIQYVNDDFETETKPFSGVVGFRLDKKYSLQYEKKIDLVWSSIMGYGFYLFDDVRARSEYANWPQSKKDDEERPLFIKPFSTVHVSQGIQLCIRDFGIQARYNYAPYAVFSDVIDSKFGAHSVTVGLFYRQ